MEILFRQSAMTVGIFKKFGSPGLSMLVRKVFSPGKVKVVFDHPSLKYPLFLRNRTSDLPTFYQIFYYKDYDFEIPEEPRVIIDCGANIGLATVYFKNRFPNARIIAIEPEPSNFALLLENTQSYPEVTCIQSGIWNKSAHLLVKDNGMGNWGFMVEESEEETVGALSAISINDILNRYDIKQIDILKIDIEGSEKEVFESNFEAWLSKTKVLIIELHDHLREGACQTFFKAMSGYNYLMIQRGENLIFFMK